MIKNKYLNNSCLDLMFKKEFIRLISFESLISVEMLFIIGIRLAILINSINIPITIKDMRLMKILFCLVVSKFNNSLIIFI